MTIHNEIMNIQARPVSVDMYDHKLMAYKCGHRDARHDAAELSLKYQAYTEALEDLIKSAGVHPSIIESIKKEKLNVSI